MEKILIIDDSQVQANHLRMILESEYEITIANTAGRGLQLAQDGEFDLILLDVVMPDMDGFQLLKRLQEEFLTQHVPVIMITSLSDTQSEERGLTLGAVDYITKPFHPLVVKARVHTHIKLYRYRLQIEKQAMFDELTGIANRRRYDSCSITKWQDAIRLQKPISLCIFDIDKFKVYNDTYGHPAGDKVIAAVAATAAAHLRRSTDFLARYGGEEFVAIILGSDAEAAFNHLKRVRQAVEDLHIPHNADIAPWVTVSVGGVTVAPQLGDAYDTYLKIADTMLYDAKRLGRNQVVWSDRKLGQMREK